MPLNWRAMASASRILPKMLNVCWFIFFGGAEFTCSISHACKNDIAASAALLGGGKMLDCREDVIQRVENSRPGFLPVKTAEDSKPSCATTIRTCGPHR